MTNRPNGSDHPLPAVAMTNRPNGSDHPLPAAAMTNTPNGSDHPLPAAAMANRPNGSDHPLPPPPERHHPYNLTPPPHRDRDRRYMGAPSPSSSSAASLKGCCCCLFLLLTFLALLVIAVVLVIVLAVVLVIVLAVKPKKPQFDLQQASVQYILVAGDSSSSSAAAAYLSLNITLLFTAENPNKVGIQYSTTPFYVMYHGVPLGVAAVPGFEQPAHSTRLVQTRVSVSRFNVLQADAVDLVRDAAVNDRVELRITGDVAAKIRLLGFTSPRVQVSVDCAIVISPRKQSLTYKQCGVDGVNL